jgi:ankyrin repeat protein
MSQHDICTINNDLDAVGQCRLEHCSTGPTRQCRLEHCSTGPVEYTNAIKTGNIKLVSKMLNNDAGLDRILFSNTPLSLAVNHGKYKMVKYLLSKGVDMNGQVHKCSSALHKVVESHEDFSRVKMLKILITEQTNFNIDDILDRTPLMAAVMNTHIYLEEAIKVIQLLLYNGANVTKKDTYGQTALDMAQTQHKIRDQNKITYDIIINLLLIYNNKLLQNKLYSLHSKTKFCDMAIITHT